MIKDVAPMLSNFIETRLGVVPNVSKDSLLEQTYGMAGLDSLSFYDDFISEFEIVLPDGFDINHYTSSDLGLGELFKSLFSKSHRRQHWYIDLTVRDLEEMIKTKKWIERKQAN